MSIFLLFLVIYARLVLNFISKYHFWMTIDMLSPPWLANSKTWDETVWDIIVQYSSISVEATGGGVITGL